MAGAPEALPKKLASSLIDWLKAAPMDFHDVALKPELPTVQQQDDESIRKFNEEMGSIGKQIV